MDPTLWQLAQPILAGQLRHVLTIGAGSLVTWGWLQQDQTSAFVAIGSGIVAGAVGSGWSWWQKVGQAALKAKVAALQQRLQRPPTTAADVQARMAAGAATTGVK